MSLPVFLVWVTRNEHTSSSFKEGYLSVSEKMASKPSQPSSIAENGPGVMIVIRSRVGEDGNSML